MTELGRSQAICYSAIQAHLNGAETMIKMMVGSFKGADPKVSADAVAFVKAKLSGLAVTFKDL